MRRESPIPKPLRCLPPPSLPPRHCFKMCLHIWEPQREPSGAHILSILHPPASFVAAVGTSAHLTQHPRLAQSEPSDPPLKVIGCWCSTQSLVEAWHLAPHPPAGFPLPHLPASPWSSSPSRGTAPWGSQQPGADWPLWGSSPRGVCKVARLPPQPNGCAGGRSGGRLRWHGLKVALPALGVSVLPKR